MSLSGLSGLSADSGIVHPPSPAGVQDLLAEDSQGLLAEDGTQLTTES